MERLHEVFTLLCSSQIMQCSLYTSTHGYTHAHCCVRQQHMARNSWCRKLVHCKGENAANYIMNCQWVSLDDSTPELESETLN